MVVLYSSTCRLWKIADFGITSPGTTTHGRQTKHGRGKQGYRAPELLSEDEAQYNKKVDIWSLGCVLFEVVTGVKAFNSDISVFTFASSNTAMQVTAPVWIAESTSLGFGALQRWIVEMLNPDWHNRPSSVELGRRFDELLPFCRSPSHTTSTTVPPGNASLTQQNMIMGTDVPTTMKALRWSEIFGSGGIQQHTRLLEHFKRILHARTQLLGPTHPSTLWARTCLAWSYFYFGQLDKAEKEFNHILVHKGRQLGSDHPEVLSTCLGLAWTQLTRGNALKASANSFQTLLENHEKVMGPEYPDTLDCKFGLAKCFCDNNKFDIAAGILSEVFEVQTKVLGDRNPDTMSTTSFLAWVYIQRGYQEQGLQMYEEVIEKQTALLGMEHPDTLDSLQGQAYGYMALGQHENAIRLFEQLLVSLTRLFGWHDPKTEETMASLIEEYKVVGEKDKIANLRREARSAPRFL